MSFTIKIRKVDNVVIMDLSGKLTIGEPVIQLRDTLRGQVAEGNLKIIVNLADVSYVDSSGLGELVSSYTTVRGKGGDIKLLKLTAKIKDLLQMTKLLTVFEVFDDEGKGLGSFKDK